MPESIPPFSDQFPQFAACFNLSANANPFGLLDTTQPPGKQRVKAEQLRCSALVEIRADVNARVLDLPNFYDCRIENPAEITEIINDAIKKAGGTADAGFLDAMLSALDDEIEGGKSEMSFLSNLINKVRDFPRQGTTDRRFLEDSVNLSLQLTDAVIGIVVKAFPAAQRYSGDARKILGILIDTVFFLGDYVAEVSAVRKEMGVRLLSKKRFDKITDAYAATYGVEPAVSTVAKWCAAGKRLDSPLMAPDGTTGEYDRALAKWQADNAIVAAAWQGLRDVFSGDFRKYIACNTILAAWYGAYAPSEVTALRADIETFSTKGNRGTVLAQSLPGPSGANSTACGAPAGPYGRERSANVLETGDPGAILCKTNYWIPFWEDRVINWNIDPNTAETVDRRIAYRKSMIAAMSGAYFDYVFARKSGQTVRDITNQWRIEDFARQMRAVIKSWYGWSVLAFPSAGNKKRDRFIRQKLIDLWPQFNGIVTSPSAGTNWKPVYPFATPDSDTAWINAVTFAFTGNAQPTSAPNPADAKYGGVRARCPDGTDSCLPGSFVNARRPIGAAPIQISMLIEWSGKYGPWRSPEFVAWAKRLSDAGYPGYAIEAIAKQAVFVAKPGASNAGTIASVILPQSAATSGRVPAAALLVPSVKIPKVSLKGAPNRMILGGTSGWSIVR